MKRAKNFAMVLAIMGLAKVACGGILIAPVMTVSDGINPTVIVLDNTSHDLNSGVGIITVSTNIGVWTLSISTGVTAPALGSFTNPVMDLVIQASSIGAGSLTYTFSDIGYSGKGTANAGLSGQVISGAPATVGYSVYGSTTDVTNALTTLLASTGPSSLPIATSASGVDNLTGPYSLTQVVQINASGASSVSIDASLNVVPEPAAAELAGLGVAFLAVFAARRRRA